MNKKDIISLVIAVALIVLLFNFNCNGKSSLEFEEVKFNTPEKVVEELGIKDLPKFSYVGNTGSAAKTPSHLHFTIATPIPYPWRIDTSTDGWKKMFYLNPIDYLSK